jgi:hypothetical protein
MSRHGNSPEESSSGSALDALLRVEHEAAERLARAQADAAALLAAATAEAAESARQAGASLAIELAAVDATHAEALRAIGEDVAQSAADTVTRYRSVTDETVQRLAAIVLSEVTGLSPAAAP